MKKIIILSLLLCAACTKSADEQDFNYNRNKWQAKAIRSYEFTLTTGCFCPVEVVGPHRIKVIDDKIITVDDSVYDASVNGNFRTIDGLFSFIDASLEKEPWKQSIVYNSAYGYPEKVYFDFYKEAVDEEIGYTISDFRLN